MTATPRRGNTFGWSWLWWTAGFLAFPIAGVAGRLVAGRVDDPTAALLAGLVTGAVVGAGQWLASRGRLRPLPWIGATTVGMGAGSAARRHRRRLPDHVGRRRRHGCAHRSGARYRPDGGATGPYPTTLVVGRDHATAVGARLDRHHPGRDSHGGADHHLRRQRCRHLLRPVRSAAVPTAAPGADRSSRHAGVEAPRVGAS